VQRLLLLLFLALFLPAWLYWAASGFREPTETALRLRQEIAALSGERPAAAPTTPPPPAPEPPEPPPGKEEAEKPEPPEPPEPPKPAPPPPPAPKELLLEGKFDESLRAATSEVEKADAKLAIALREAFPPDVPNAPYVRIRTAGGAVYEGFAEETAGQIRILRPGGSSMAFPNSAVTDRQFLARDEALAAMENSIRMQAGEPGAAAPALFQAMEQALRIGRPSAAAPALLRILDTDLSAALFPTSVRQRVPAERQSEIHRAYIACMNARAPKEAAPSVRAPRKLGGDEAPRTPRIGEPSLKDPKAKELVSQAAESRRAGEALYEKIQIDGLKGAKGRDIESAIRLLEKAIDDYLKAQEIEESGAIQSAITACSRKSRNLRFWQMQVEARD
jgi:hypothetical protein